MRIVIALGGNALLKRGEPMTAGRQRSNVRVAAAALARVATDHELVISHGNGPQIGLLALSKGDGHIRIMRRYLRMGIAMKWSMECCICCLLLM